MTARIRMMWTMGMRMRLTTTRVTVTTVTTTSDGDESEQDEDDGGTIGIRTMEVKTGMGFGDDELMMMGR